MKIKLKGKSVIRKISIAILIFTVVVLIAGLYKVNMVDAEDSSAAYKQLQKVEAQKKGEDPSKVPGVKTGGDSQGRADAARMAAETSAETKAAEENSRLKSENQGLLDKLGEIVKAIGKLFKEGIVWLLEITFGRMLEAFYLIWAPSISNWLLITPRLLKFDFILVSWIVSVLLSTVLLAIGAGLCIKKMVTGKSSVSNILMVLGVGFVFSFFSLFLIDLTGWAQNQMWNVVTKETLTTLYEKNGGVSAAYIGKKNEGTGQRAAITKDNIKLSTVDGDTLLKLAFATDDESKRKVFNGTPFYSLFLSSNDSDGAAVKAAKNTGGLLLMIWVMLMLILLGLFAFARFGSVIYLGITGPCYIAAGTFIGDIKPIAGYANLTARTIILQSIIDGAWFAMASSQDLISMLGVSPIAANAVILTVAVALSWFFWIIWLRQAIKAPLTLGGGAVVKHFGDMGTTVGTVIKRVGERYGDEGLQDFGDSLSSGGRKIAGKGSEMMMDGLTETAKRITGSDEYANKIANFMMRNEDSEEPRNTDIYTKGDIRSHKENVSWDGLSLTDSNGSKLDNAESKKVIEYLRNKGFREDTLRVSNGNLMVRSDYSKDAVSAVNNYYSSSGNLGQVNIDSNIDQSSDTRNFVRFNTHIAYEEHRKILERINKELPKGACKHDEEGERKRGEGNAILVPAEYADKVEKIIETYQKGKTKYWQDKDNNYICYDDNLGNFVKYKTPPVKGIHMGIRT